MEGIRDNTEEEVILNRVADGRVGWERTDSSDFTQGLFTHWCQALSSESPSPLPWQDHLPPQGSQRR